MDTKPHEKIFHKELSYQVQGAAIEVRKNFGPGFKESIYQNAFAEELQSRNLQFEKEKSIQIFSPKTGKLVGSYRPDFIVEEKILVELKAIEKIPKMFVDQLYSYLRNSEYELGYFINFASPRLYIKRIIFTNDRKPFLKKTLKITNSKRIVTTFSCLLVFLFVLFSVFAPMAQAAEIYFGVHNPSVGVGSIFGVGVFLKTGGENINAIEGKILFPREQVTLKEVREGNSLVSLWIQKPEMPASAEGFDEAQQELFFSGLVPGGFTGEDGYLFSLFFEAKQKGQVRIETEAEQILLADGQGSKASVEQAPLTLMIEEGERVNELPPFNDPDPPESFTPQVARDSSIFGGKWFLVFSAQDKRSGIDYYEIQETREKRQKTSGWIKAESPYLLQDQGLRSYIYVKAVDKAGNERIETLARQNPEKWYENPITWSIIIGIGGALVFWLWRKKNTKYHE